MSASSDHRATPTMRDVADAAGVSKALVSIVFRGAPGASAATRARVFATAQRLGYRTNRTASLLKLRRTKHVGVTMSVRNAFHAELVEGIQSAADVAGYQIVLGAVTDGHGERRAVQTLLEFRCEALILLGSELDAAALTELASVVPVVLVGRRTPVADIDAVRTADDRGQGLLVDHLVAQGHREIVHVDGGVGSISAERRRGYRTAMRRHGLPGRILTGGSDESDGWQAAGQLLLEPATGVTAFNDRCALGVLDRLRQEGVAVPEQVAVAGYDNSSIARLTAVSLTSVSQEPVDQAEQAVRAAVERLDGVREHGQEFVLQPRLVVRGTTDPI